MITLFSSPRPFRGHFDIIQRNAILSWKSVMPGCEIILFEDEEGTTKKVAEALRKEAEPLKVLGILRRDIPALFFQATRAEQSARTLSPREVILSSYLLEAR